MPMGLGMSLRHLPVGKSLSQLRLIIEHPAPCLWGGEGGGEI